MTANDMKYAFQLKFDSLFEMTSPAYENRQISYILTEAQFRVFLRKYNPYADKYRKGFEGDEQRRRDLEQLIKAGSIYGKGVSGSIEYVCSWSSGNNVITIVSGGDVASTIGLNEGLTITGTGIGKAGTTTTNTIKNILTSTTFTVEDTPAASGTSVTLTSGLGKSSVQGFIHPNGVFLDLPDGFMYAIEEAAQLENQPTEAWIKPVRHDEFLANISNPYKKPYKDLVWRMDFSKVQQAEGTNLSTSKRTELILPVDSTGTQYVLEQYRIRYLSVPPAIVCDDFDETNQRHCILDESIHRDIVDEAVLIAQAAAQKESYQIGLSEKQRSE